MVIVLMGPAGAGKSTVGVALAERLGWRFIDGDDHHSPANVAKIGLGTSLTDADRAAWLGSLHAIVAKAIERREHLVMACSALTRAHRARLAGGARHVRFVYLKVAPGQLRARLDSRRGHFAGAGILDGQLATLEEPGEDEALVADGAADVDTIISHIRLEFGI